MCVVLLVFQYTSAYTDAKEKPPAGLHIARNYMDDASQTSKLKTHIHIKPKCEGSSWRLCHLQHELKGQSDVTMLRQSAYLLSRKHDMECSSFTVVFTFNTNNHDLSCLYRTNPINILSDIGKSN